MDRPHAPNRTALAVLLVAIGGHGIATQVVILRELMAMSAGSEISAGIGLGVWIAAEAAGALLAGRIAGRRTEPLLFWLVAVSVATAPAGVLAAILGPALLGALPGEGIDIPGVGMVTLVSGAIPAMAHGALFVLGLVALGESGKNRGSIGPGYICEGLGTALAAALVWLLLPRVNSLTVVALSGMPMVIVTGIETTLRSSGRRQRLGLPVTSGMLVLLSALTWRSTDMTLRAWTRSWRGQIVTAVENSAYGKVVRLERCSQKLLAYDGSMVMSEPETDPAYVEQSALIPLLVHPRPRHALVVGPGFRLLPALVNSPLESVTLVQIDPILQREAERIIKPQATAALAHPKVRSIADDPRRFLNSNVRRFDCILVSGAAPANLAANRIFTREFFALCRRNLAGDGILSVSGPGPTELTSTENRQTLGTRIASLEAAFPCTRLVLLDFPLLLSSANPLDIRPETLEQRLRSWAWQPAVLQPDYLARLLSASRQKLLGADLPPAHSQHSAVNANTDLHPAEVFQSLLRESRLSSPWFADVYRTVSGSGTLPLAVAATAFLVAVLVGSAIVRYRIADPFSISSSGFAGGAISTLVLFAYRSRFGSMFSGIGLLLASFMIGTVLGGWVGTAVSDRKSFRTVVFLLADSLLLLTSGILLVITTQGPAFLFLVAQFFAGTAVGAQFPIAGVRLPAAAPGSRASYVAACDLAGGFLGAICCAVFVLPIWGITAAVLLVACAKLTSLLGQCLAGRPGQ